MINKSEHFPRCEYRTRFEGTTAFDMSEPKFWGGYFRSTFRGGNSDRLSSKLKDTKKFQNTEINSAQDFAVDSKTGSFHSPFRISEYAEIVREVDIWDISYNHSNLYEETLYEKILKYKKAFCASVLSKAKEAKGLEGVNIVFSNNYPCLMVQLPFCTKELHYKMASAYLVAFADYIAFKKNIPIEMVLRSSFGHNIPSVAATGESLRINVGLVPTIYADVIIAALKELKIFMYDLKKKRISDCDIDIQDLNAKLSSYRDAKQAKKDSKGKKAEKTTELKELQEAKTIWHILTMEGVIKNSSLLKEILRQNEYSDLLADLVLQDLYTQTHKEIRRPNEGSDRLAGLTLEEPSAPRRSQAQLYRPLIGLIRGLDFNGSVTLKNYPMSEIFAKKKRRFAEAFDAKINEDTFWTLIGSIASALSSSELSEQVSRRSILGLYAALEKANDNFICRSGSIKAEDGYGSDSESEVALEGATVIYSKKITLVTGMRAINIAGMIAGYHLRKTSSEPDFETAHMYYETADALKLLNLTFDFYKDSLPTLQSTDKAIIYCFDLTHCNTKCTGDSQMQIPVGCKIAILDYTSATQEIITNAVQTAFRAVELVILVSSGLKNEQCGADVNPYGTVRILSKSQHITFELYVMIKGLLNKEKEAESLPAPAHKIRKAYKKAGLGCSTESILNARVTPTEKTDYIIPADIEESTKTLHELMKIQSSIEVLMYLGFSQNWLTKHSQNITRSRHC